MGVRSRRWHQHLFRIHSWCGLVLGLLLFVICLSGTLAVFAHEIDWLTDPDLRVPRYEGAPAWDAMAAAAEARYPAAVLQRLQAPRGPRSAAVGTVRWPDGRLGFVYFDPRDGRITGDGHWLTAQRFFRNFHRRFFTGWGLYLVSAFGVVLLVSALTPLWFYRHWWRKFFSFSGTGDRRRLWSELHKLGGLWSLWFALVIGITGTWYLVEQLIYDLQPAALSSPMPQLNDDRLAALPEDARLVSLSAQVARAQAAIPGLQVASVAPSLRRQQPVYIDGQQGSLLVRDRAAQVWLDPYDGTVIHLQTPRSQTAFERWVDTADPLHFGDFAGLWSQWPWFIAGLVLSGLVLSGVYLQWQRLQARAVMARRRGRPVPKRAWGSLEWTGVATLLVLLGLTLQALGDYRHTAPLAWQPLANNEAMAVPAFVRSAAETHEVFLRTHVAGRVASTTFHELPTDAVLTTVPGGQLLQLPAAASDHNGGIRVRSREGPLPLPTAPTVAITESPSPWVTDATLAVLALFGGLLLAVAGLWLRHVRYGLP